MTSQAAPGIFVRQATGLVREAGTWSTLIYNINFVSIGLMMLFVIQLEPAFYPGGNMLGSYVLALLIVLPTSLVFAMLAAAMPRSGGDYVYVSRILGPRLGMTSSWINTVWWFIYGGVPSAFLARYGLGPLCRSVGLISGNGALIDAGNWFVTPEGTVITGAILIAALVTVFSLGLHGYFRIQNALFVIAMVGLGIVALVLLTGSGATFQENFDRFWGPVTGQASTYQAIVDGSTAAGFTEAPSDLYWTLIPITWIYLELVFNQSSAYIGGEVKQASRIQLWSMPIAAIVSVAIAVVLTALFQSTIGTQFLGAAGFDYGATLGITTPPTFSELAAYLSGNVLVALLLGVGFVFWSYTWLPGQILNASRNLLAYGIDGVMPAKLGAVSERHHTPIVALVVVGLASAAALVVYAYNPDFTTLVGIVAFIVSFVIVSIAAIAFPFRRRELFEASPVNWRWAGIPVISIVGALSLGACLVAEWAYLNDPLSGVNILDGFGLKPFTGEDGAPTKDIVRFLIAAGTVVSGLVIYEIARWYRARQGIRLEAAYREIPVE
ncbi:MAG: amino acid permease [Chloroflexi bacterium GWC2_73_18]|nr:MAG: amino acid permease [Chloroflexi bacterium GWC2_73_18]